MLIAGGTASYGPSFDIEIYDPASGTSVHAGDMTLARVDHAAATLKDGRVLIVGGSDGVAPLNLAEIFDPATGQSAGVAAPCPSLASRPRPRRCSTGTCSWSAAATARTISASAEIFDPATGSFFATGAMQTARSGHVAVLLPNNNQVLIAGGMSAGAAVASAELYADWRDGFSATPNPMSAARAGGIAGGLQPYDLAFVAGGGATSGEYYGYATVKTDKEDYWPGEPVTVTGSGWQPGETVTLTISEDADTHYDFTYSAIADEAGNITNAEFAPIQNEIFQHFGKKFYVTARGAASEALNTFTDGNGTITGTIRNSVTNAVIAGATITCSNVGPNPCNSIETATSIANGTYTSDFNFPGNSSYREHHGVRARLRDADADAGVHQQSDANNQLGFWFLSRRHNAHGCSRHGPYGGNTAGGSHGDTDRRRYRRERQDGQLHAERRQRGQRDNERRGVATLAS